jgi:hypothetical protein
MSTRSRRTEPLPWRALALALASALALAAALPQTRPKIPPPDFTRETEADAAGQLQWKPFDVECPHCKGAKSHVCENCKEAAVPVCQECDGSKRATCRVCGGVGKLPDPLVELACPICEGSSWYRCGLCNSFGYLEVDGKKTNCGACKQKGLLACVACGGRRRVDTVRVGRDHVGLASLKELQALLPKLREAQEALAAFEPDPNPSKSAKAFAKTFDPIKRELAAAKDLQEMLDVVLKGIKSYGAGYTGYEDRLVHQFLVFKDRAVFLLQHQVRAAEQALARAEANESK